VDFFAAPQPKRSATNGAGIFRFEELPYGRYTVRFSDSDGRYFATEYRETEDATAATVISLDRSAELTITAVVEAASLITGNVTIDGAIATLGGQVSAYYLNEGSWSVGGSGNVVAATGNYTITGLPGRTYRLQVNTGLPVQIFHGGATLETATDITVVTGTVVGGITIDLAPYLAGLPYGRISGLVTRDGAPQPAIQVVVYQAGFDCCIAPPSFVTTLTDAEGRYSIGGLPPGQYKIGIGLPDQSHPILYAPDQRTFESATVFVIGDPADGTSRQVITDVNTSLVATGSIARRVLRPDDRPLVGATVNLYQRLGEPGQFPLVASTQTDEEGRYTFGSLVPDLYQLCIVAEGMGDPSCGGRGGLGMGFDVAVIADQETTGIDIVNVP
jgi:hypothetical protein